MNSRRRNPDADQLAEFQSLTLDEVSDPDLRRRISESINLMENVNRGTVAEVLVATALGGTVTDAWGDWDVELDGGTRIEVKSTGLVQAWPQRKPSSVTWQIRKTHCWDLGDDGYTQNPEFRRRSDFYVLAMHNGNLPDDTGEWMFYVVPTPAIDEALGDQKTINERSVQRAFGLEPPSYSQLSSCSLPITPDGL